MFVTVPSEPGMYGVAWDDKGGGLIVVEFYPSAWEYSFQEWGDPPRVWVYVKEDEDGHYQISAPGSRGNECP